MHIELDVSSIFWFAWRMFLILAVYRIDTSLQALLDRLTSYTQCVQRLHAMQKRTEHTDTPHEEAMV